MSMPFVLYTDGANKRSVMATLSELAETVAEVEGMDLARVNLIPRNVREGGLIATTGRGPSAAIMDVSDAANLLIAVNAVEIVKEAAQTVRVYRRLEAPDTSMQHYPTLSDALEQLIEAAANGILPQRYLSRTVPPRIAQEFCEQKIKVEVTFHKPMPQVFLSIGTPGIGLVNGGEFVDDAERDIYIKDAENWLAPTIKKGVTQLEYEFDLPTGRANVRPAKNLATVRTSLRSGIRRFGQSASFCEEKLLDESPPSSRE